MPAGRKWLRVNKSICIVCFQPFNNRFTLVIRKYMPKNPKLISEESIYKSVRLLKVSLGYFPFVYVLLKFLCYISQCPTQKLQGNPKSKFQQEDWLHFLSPECWGLIWTKTFYRLNSFLLSSCFYIYQLHLVSYQIMISAGLTIRCQIFCFMCYSVIFNFSNLCIKGR